MQALYYTLGILVILFGGLKALFYVGKRAGNVETKIDNIQADVTEIKTNHLVHLDQRIVSIEEYLRK